MIMIMWLKTARQVIIPNPYTWWPVLSRLVAMDWRVRTWLPAYIGWIISTEKSMSLL
jgi:hypothetical protein